LRRLLMRPSVTARMGRERLKAVRHGARDRTVSCRVM
jgi:hypothetical protein